MFGLSRECHRTERDYEDDAGLGRRVFSEWSRHWELDKELLLEKSPYNLVRTRLLQALFPNSCFIMMIRDPRTSYIAASRTIPNTAFRDYLRNWQAAYETFLDDQHFLHRSCLIRYENLIFSFDRTIGFISRFLGLRSLPRTFRICPDIELAYRVRWNALLSQGIVSEKAFVLLPEWATQYRYTLGYFKDADETGCCTHLP